MRIERGAAPLQRTVGPDIRPTVGRTDGSTSIWLFSGAALLAAILLFTFLDGRRRELAAPSTDARLVDQVRTVSSLPPLVFPYVPPPPPVPIQPDLVVTTAQVVQPPESPAFAPQPAPHAQYVPRPPSPPPPPPARTDAPPQYIASAVSASDVPRRPASSTGLLVIDTAAGPSVETAPDGPHEPGAQAATPRSAVHSSPLLRRAATVPEGTLIPAVLETALDSSRPGFARAIVSQDITGFDGSRVLIPRGSRLFGTYQTELGAGQNRATVQWTRLVRPDGITIALDSPAADPRGRAGLAGRVNNRYLERFVGALLQTTMNVGANLAGRGLGDGALIVALPGSTQGGAAAPSENAIRPTLRVEAGTRVSVLVARDLEFSSGDRVQ